MRHLRTALREALAALEGARHAHKESLGGLSHRLGVGPHRIVARNLRRREAAVATLEAEIERLSAVVEFAAALRRED
jgi:hypothetical protein